MSVANDGMILGAILGTLEAGGTEGPGECYSLSGDLSVRTILCCCVDASGAACGACGARVPAEGLMGDG